MNEYIAFLKEIDNDIEEQVTLIVNNIEVTCFASVCPFEIYEGKKYLVSIKTSIIDDYKIEEMFSNMKNLEKLGNDFSYLARGFLKNGILDCGITFERDDIFLSEFGYLDGRFVQMEIDRIDVEFLAPL